MKPVANESTAALKKLVDALDDFLAAENKTDRVMSENLRTAFRAAKKTLAQREKAFGATSGDAA